MRYMRDYADQINVGGIQAKVVVLMFPAILRMHEQIWKTIATTMGAWGRIFEYK